MMPLYQFFGGVHPPQHKEESTAHPIVAVLLPAKLVVPLHQHIGNSAKALVQPGDKVLKGQLIGAAEGYVSTGIHAPTSGTVAAVDMQTVAHPSGLSDLCVTIIPDGEDKWIPLEPLDYLNLAPSALRNCLRDAGIAGLGGAVFPTFIKLNPGSKKLNTLVINGAECEPYITCDDMLMRERADDIVKGIEMMQFMLNADQILIGIEDNKPHAIAAMETAIAKSTVAMRVVVVPTIYPGGGAKQLIKMLTNVEVPAGERSSDLGVQCFNIATAYTLYRAIAFGEPVISRIVTVTGNVEKPQNFEVLIGTPMEHIVALAGLKPGTDSYIMGGPMMGITLPSADVPVVKATNCIIASSPKLFPPSPPAMPCIRCSKCAEVCPAELQPQELYWFAKAKNFGKAQEYALFDCIECGACSYVCPSHIPLVQYYRFAKSEIWSREKEKKSADQARERFEFRQLRIEREKQEKAEKMAQKAAAAKQAPAAPTVLVDKPASDPKQIAIEQAIERAKAKKAGITPQNIDNLSPEKQAEIAEIEIRRARIREIARQKPEDQVV